MPFFNIYTRFLSRRACSVPARGVLHFSFRLSLIFLKVFLYFYNKQNTFWTHFHFMIVIKIVDELTISPLIRKCEKVWDAPDFFVVRNVTLKESCADRTGVTHTSIRCPAHSPA